MIAMDSAALAVLYLLFLLPLLLGIFSIFKKILPTNRLIESLLCLSLAGLSLLAWAGEQTFDLPLSFLGEWVSLSISMTAVLLYALLVVVLGVLLYVSRANRDRSGSRYETALLAFSLSFGTLAFFSNQFMIRYIALELVGLLAALSVCTSVNREGFRRFGNIFLTLRVGDIGLLASILLILPESGTLAIPEMVNAAVALPLPQRIWVVVGFVLAGVVKMGVIPFSGWQKQAWSGKSSPTVWIPGFLMPGLGMYLLYRVYPVLASDGLFRVGLPILAIALILAQVMTGLLQQRVQPRFIRIGSVHNALVLMIAAQGSGVLLRDYFLGLVLYRMIVFLQNRERRSRQHSLLDFFPIFLNLSVLVLHWEVFTLVTRVAWVGLTVLSVLWDRLLAKREVLGETIPAVALRDSPGMLTTLAEKLYTLFEVNLFSQGVVRLAGLFSRLVGGLHQHLEINVLSHGLINFAALFGKASGWLQQNLELGFDRAWTGLGNTLTRVSAGWLSGVEINADRKAAVWTEDVLESVEEREQEIQFRPLHRDLVWIPILMLFILGFLYIFQGG